LALSLQRVAANEGAVLQGRCIWELPGTEICLTADQFDMLMERAGHKATVLPAEFSDPQESRPRTLQAVAAIEGGIAHLQKE